MSLTWKQKYGKPKSASYVVIMVLHKGLTHIQSQIKPRLLFGESFTLNIIGFLTRPPMEVYCIICESGLQKVKLIKQIMITETQIQSDVITWT